MFVDVKIFDYRTRRDWKQKQKQNLTRVCFQAHDTHVARSVWNLKGFLFDNKFVFAVFQPRVTKLFGSRHKPNKKMAL